MSPSNCNRNCNCHHPPCLARGCGSKSLQGKSIPPQLLSLSLRRNSTNPTSGILISIGGPAFVEYIRPSDEELRKRYNPDLQKRAAEQGSRREQEFDDYVTKLKEWSKSDKSSRSCPRAPVAVAVAVAVTLSLSLSLHLLTSLSSLVRGAGRTGSETGG